MTAAGRRLSQLARIPVTELRHVGAQRQKALELMQIHSVFDLLVTYPRRWVDRTHREDLSDLTVGEEVAVLGDVTRVVSRRTRQGKSLVEATVADDGGAITAVFFNQPWRQKQLAEGTQALLFGKVSDYRGRRQMTNPVVDVLVGASGVEREASKVLRVVPIYPASGKAGLTSWEIGGFVAEALERAGTFIDPVPEAVRARYGLVGRTEAFVGIHLPAKLEDRFPAMRRLAFDELWRLMLLLALRRARLNEESRGVAHPANVAALDVAAGELADGSLVARFLAGHRFTLTNAQRQVLGEIFTDLASPLPMHRLLQGDVGSGKTTVALAAMLAVAEGGRQSVLMAPTEVLAEQHLQALRADLHGLTVADPAVLGGERPVNVQLLTGRTKGRDRGAVLNGLEAGTIDLVVGTHALLTEDVKFRALGLVVIDEQHRFGVEQRATLRDKGRSHSLEGADPDLLVMTATPIPRTAALVYFADLDLSVVNEMPAGREPVTTSWAVDADDVAGAFARVREEVARGHRAFVVCPLVEASERIEAASASSERDRLAAHELAGLRVGLLHGQMSGGEKDQVMTRFRDGDLDVLVATVVIEVGVDVPAATVMVVLDAWRFGLAQLHQLRGRVGRGGGQSWCYLVGEAPTDEARQRLEALVRTNDGFELARIDLALRGEGTLLGARQRGRSDLRLARLDRDGDLVEMAREAAFELVTDAHALADHAEIEDELRLFVDEDEAQYLFKS